MRSQQEAQSHVQQVRQEAQGHVHLLRQEAVSHVERARHEAEQTRSAAEAEVARLRQILRIPSHRGKVSLDVTFRITGSPKSRAC